MSKALPLNRKPRVLLLSASSGAGHVRAAQALEKEFLAHGDCSVEHIDALTLVSKVFQQLYDKAYIKMVRHTPALMGLLYDRTDQPWQHPRPARVGPAEYPANDPYAQEGPAGSVHCHALFAGGNSGVADREK